MAHIKRAVKRGCRRHVVVRVSQFDRSVEVAHATHATPFKNCRTVDVPREVEQNIASRHTFRQKAVEIFAGHLTDFVFDALFDRISNTMAVVDKVDDRYRTRRKF